MVAPYIAEHYSAKLALWFGMFRSLSRCQTE
jgi:hypothetical protein